MVHRVPYTGKNKANGFAAKQGRSGDLIAPGFLSPVQLVGQRSLDQQGLVSRIRQADADTVMLSRRKMRVGDGCDFLPATIRVARLATTPR